MRQPASQVSKHHQKLKSKHDQGKNQSSFTSGTPKQTATNINTGLHILKSEGVHQVLSSQQEQCALKGMPRRIILSSKPQYNEYPQGRSETEKLHSSQI
jgi:hypothetical protein